MSTKMPNNFHNKVQQLVKSSMSRAHTSKLLVSVWNQKCALAYTNSFLTTSRRALMTKILKQGVRESPQLKLFYHSLKKERWVVMRAPRSSFQRWLSALVAKGRPKNVSVTFARASACASASQRTITTYNEDDSSNI